MATSYLEDKSKYRANQWATTWSGEAPPEVDAKIGRKDPTYITAVEVTPTVSGTTLRTNYR